MSLAFVSSWDKHSDGSGNYGLTSYICSDDGSLEKVQKVDPEVLFGFTYFDKEKNLLYALEETGDNKEFRSAGGGKIHVYKVNSDGQMNKIDCRATWSPSPCYLSIDKSKKYLLVTHHGSYNAVTKIGQDENGGFYPVIVYDDMVIELFSLEEDGRIGRLLDVLKCVGDGPDKRQVHAHPHTVLMSPSGKLFAVCDKGNDWIEMLQIVSEDGRATLKKCGEGYKHKPGTTPRHCAFSPDGKWFYHNTEASSKIFSFSCSEDGKLNLVSETDAVLPGCEKVEPHLEQQGFVMNSQGSALYSIVRGPNVVSVMKTNSNTGSLEVIQNKRIDGLWPRGCALSLDEKHFYVCCRDSGEIVNYSVNEDGTLNDAGKRFSNPGAAFITVN